MGDPLCINRLGENADIGKEMGFVCFDRIKGNRKKQNLER